jgi:signal transduction histidine kinase
LVAEALELTRDSVRKAKLDPELVSVQQDVPESIVVPLARHQIVIALANVLKNAYEAFQFKGTMRPGAIRIAASTCHKWVTLTIEDTGQGICDEELRTPLLLTPGRRNKSKRHSTGYGLPIAARNVAAHGGLLRLESREDEGTADLGIAGRWREASLHLHRDPLGVQPQDRVEFIGPNKTGT